MITFVLQQNKKLKHRKENDMTQEEKELVLKDLCTRLPYGVKSKSQASHLEINTIDGYFVDEDGTKMFHLSEPDFWQEVEYFQYYLRPMSSMTDEEKVEIQDLYHQNTQEVFKDPDEIRGYRFYDISVVDWLNSHHFDYRGLIEKGLVLEAPEGMYKQ